MASHTINLWDRIIEQKLRHETNVSENKFGFILQRSIMELHALRILKRGLQRRKGLNLAFIDLEKAYDRITREVIGIF